MDPMKSRFRDLGRALHSALAAQPGGLEARISEEAALLAAAQRGLLGAGLGSLGDLLLTAHRADPRLGLRGSELVLVTSSHAAASRMRLAQSIILSNCQSLGLGIQSIKIRAVKATAALPRPVAAARPEVPPAARARLLALIEGPDDSAS